MNDASSSALATAARDALTLMGMYGLDWHEAYSKLLAALAEHDRKVSDTDVIPVTMTYRSVTLAEIDETT